MPATVQVALGIRQFKAENVIARVYVIIFERRNGGFQVQAD